MRGLALRVSPGWGVFRIVLLSCLLSVVGYVYYFWHLGWLTPGLGPAEYISRQNSQDLTAILNNGINAPYYLLQNATTRLLPNTTTGLRLSSIIIGLVIFGCLFGLLRSWFGRTSSLFAGLVFISTGWLLVIPRNAGPLIMYLWPIVLLAFFVWTLRAKRRPGLIWLGLCAVTAIGIYIPGVIWLVAGAALFSRRTIADASRRVSRTYIASGLVLAFLVLLPLVQAMVLEPSRIRDLILIPAKFPTVLESFKSIAWSGAALFWHTRSHIDTIVGRLAIFNVLQVALVVFGVFALVDRAPRLTYQLLGVLLFAVVVSGLNNNIELLGLGLVSITVFIAAGLRYLYIEWRRVFPFNPFSFGLAIGLIGLVVAIQMVYGIRYGLAAWPNTDATKSTYVLK